MPLLQVVVKLAAEHRAHSQQRPRRREDVFRRPSKRCMLRDCQEVCQSVGRRRREVKRDGGGAALCPCGLQHRRAFTFCTVWAIAGKPPLKSSCLRSASLQSSMSSSCKMSSRLSSWRAPRPQCSLLGKKRLFATSLHATNQRNSK